MAIYCGIDVPAKTMAGKNWQRVKETFHQALRLDEGERDRFLDKACDGDIDFRIEVESLLISFADAKQFLERPIVGDFDRKDNWRLADGHVISHYRILSPIASGGMGEVYLAEDTQLSRRVAIKLLPSRLSEDRDRLRRFEHEARVVSALNHPNILTIFEFGNDEGMHFLATEFVSGETLRERLSRGRIGLADAVDIATQIVSALKAAHEAGIIHRDIKPENIMIRDDGIVKVLDFGLAKLTEKASQNLAAGAVSMQSSPGVIMGTVTYMSPEQTRGTALDARSDIFSFGVVFFEMIAGKAPFSGETTADIIAAMIQSDPPLISDVVPTMPSQLDTIIGKTLKKDAAERYGSASELLTDLRRLAKSGEFERLTNNRPTEPHGSEMGSVPPSKKHLSHKTVPLFSRSRRSARKPAPAGDVAAKTDPLPNRKTAKPEQTWRRYSTFLSIPAVIAGVAVLAWGLWQYNKTNATDAHSFDALRPVRVVSWRSGTGNFFTDYRLSNDDRMIAYSSTQSGESEDIYIKQIDSESSEVRVTRDGWLNYSPIWSPDNQRIAYASLRDGKHGIYVSPSLGGSSTQLKMIEGRLLSLRHWSRDGSAIFYELDGNLFRLDLATRETVQLTNIAPSTDVEKYFSFSPDESRIAYCDNRNGVGDIWVMPQSGGEAVRLTNDADQELRPRWHPDGKRILYSVIRDRRRQINLAYLDGRPPVQVTRSESEYEMIDVSADGKKIFFTTLERHSDIGRVEIETSEESDFAAGVESEFWADVSPDGRSILFQTNGAAHLTPFLSESSIIVKSLEGQSQQLLLNGYDPHWLTDGRSIAFLRWQKPEQRYNLWRVDIATGEELQVTTDGVSSPSVGLMPLNRGEIGSFDWSPVEAKLVYLEKGKSNVWTALPGSGDRSNLTNNADPNIRYYSPLWSRNGKMIAYVSEHKDADRNQNPMWRVWLTEDGKEKELFSTKESLRIVGWAASGELVLETVEGVMRDGPSEVKLIAISVTGALRIISTLKNIYPSSMALSTDGKLVVFASRQNDLDNIWIATINGSDLPGKVTDNRNSRIFFGSPTFSPNGGTIFFDKQDQINTISMFDNFE